MKVTIDTSKPLQLSWGGNGTDRIVRNVVNLLRTFRYEVPFMLTCGLDPDVMSRPLDEAAALIVNQALDFVGRYEQRAKLKALRLMGVEEDGMMVFEAVIEI